MGNVVVDTSSYNISADSPATAVIALASLTVNSSTKLKGNSQTVALKSDMEGQASTTTSYISGTYVIPGVLQWDGKLLGSQESAKLQKDGFGVIVDDTPSGTVNFSVSSPASVANPSPPPATLYDPQTSYTGTWSMTTAGQSKLTTTE